MVTLWYDENEARECWRKEALEEELEKGRKEETLNIHHICKIFRKHFKIQKILLASSQWPIWKCVYSLRI